MLQLDFPCKCEILAEGFHVSSFQAAKKSAPGSSSSPQKLKGQADGSSSIAVASSTVKPSGTVSGQTQAPKSKGDKTALRPEAETDVFTAPANAPGSWKREKIGVVAVYEPASGTTDKNSEAFQLSGSTAVM